MNSDNEIWNKVMHIKSVQVKCTNYQWLIKRNIFIWENLAMRTSGSEEECNKIGAIILKLNIYGIEQKYVMITVSYVWWRCI